MKEKQWFAKQADLEGEKEELIKKLAGRETQLKNQEKNITDLKQEKDGLNMKTIEANNESIKVNI